MSRSRGLGRGFDSLIPQDVVDEKFDLTGGSVHGKLVDLPINQIEPNPDQPRKTFESEAMASLEKSLDKQGLLQPIIVTRRDDKYQIVAGERRWRAAKNLGWTSIAAIVRSYTEQKQLELSIVENLQRKNLNMFEIATSYAKLRSQFNMNTDQIAEMLGRHRRSIYMYLGLLKFTDKQRELIVENKIPPSLAAILSEIPESARDQAVRRAVKEKWSVNDARRYAALCRDAEAGNKSFADLTYTRDAGSKTLAEFQKSENNLNSRYNNYGSKVHIRNHGRTISFVCDTVAQARALAAYFENADGRPAETNEETKTMKAAAEAKAKPAAAQSSATATTTAPTAAAAQDAPQSATRVQPPAKSGVTPDLTSQAQAMLADIEKETEEAKTAENSNPDFANITRLLEELKQALVPEGN